jgi:hypothetical protein
MRHIKRYSELFESESNLTKRQTEFLNRYTNGKWSVNPSTGLVDVDGDFDCSERRLFTLSGIKFGSVTGVFNCYDNELTSLKGAPEKVDGDFRCDHNDLLTSLEGAPKEVGGDFDCSVTKLNSLVGAPKEVGGDFICSFNKLTSLEGAPERVDGEFYLKSYYEHFKWTPKGKIGFIGEHPEFKELLLPTLPFEDILKIVSEDPSLLGTIEGVDKSLYNKVLKGLGWDKMGPDLLRQLKDGIL